MTDLIWTLPALAVIAAIAVGRLGTLAASLVGLSAALAVAFTTPPLDFRVADGLASLARRVDRLDRGPA